MMSTAKKESASAEAQDNNGFTKKHEGLWQLIKFTVFSCLAAIVEVISFAVLSSFLPNKLPEDFNFFVFHYTNDKGLCLGAFIAFFVSAVLAEIVSFLVNRKATFNANNNFAKSAVMYALLVIVVICLKTWIVTVLTPVIENITQINLLIEWIPKFASMTLAFVIVFPMNKFVIMKHTDKAE